jgi:PadR family transcriptional regulator, regulatory protein PadR
MRMTLAVARVLRVFLADVSQARYGYDLMRQTGYPSGTLYPILARLQHAGWLSKTTEQIEPSQAARPARSMYLLTGHGIEAARHELAVLSQDFSFSPQPSLRPQPEGGGA